MTDTLVELSANDWFREGVKQLGLPIPTPQRLRRAHGGVQERPLEGKTVAVHGNNVAIGRVLAHTLCGGGASCLLLGQSETPSFWNEAAEAYARPLTRQSAIEAQEDAKVHAMVIDATGFRGPEDLRALYDVGHRWIKRIQRCGRLIVVGRAPAEAKSPAKAAAQAALEGFIRSAARELGGRGSTAHVVYISGRSESRLPGLFRYLLTERSAFLTGQPWRVTVDSKIPRATGWERALDGKIALVTGAARGIGAATATRLAEEGARVICLDRPGDEDLTSRIAQRIGGLPLMVDITADDAPALIQRAIIERFGGVDIIVHNAGITRDKTLARMKPEWWDQAVDVNLGAVLRINDRLLKRGVNDFARIVCLSSVAGIAGNIGQTNYAASKAGLVGYVAHLSSQLSDRGITVNAVAPGFIETRLTQAIPAVTREAGRRMSALGQGGEPADVAELITFLSSPGSSGLTGQVIRACGGMFIGA